MWAGRVVHAAQALASQRVAVLEQHVGVAVVMAVAGLTCAANHHGVSIVARCTPTVEGYSNDSVFKQCDFSQFQLHTLGPTEVK